MSASSTKSLLLALSAVALLAPKAVLANMSTVTYSAQEPGGGLGLPSAEEVSVGALIRFGYFDASVDFSNMWSDVSLLNTHFTELATSLVGDFGGVTIIDNAGVSSEGTPGTPSGSAGVFAASVSLDASVLGLASTRMYIWAFDTSTTGAATAQGIFSGSEWIIGSSPTLTFDISGVSPTGPGDVYLATQGPETAPNAKGMINKLIPIATVPEPSSLLCLSLAALCITRRRRP